MGLLSYLRGDDVGEKALTASPAVVEAAANGSLNLYPRLGGTNVNAEINARYLMTQSASYAYLYEHQPAVRKVVDYIAKNVAQIGPKLYERVDDNDRRPAEDHPAAETMAHPNDLGPADGFVLTLVSEFLVHDNAYAIKFRRPGATPRIMIPVPAAAVAVNATSRLAIDSYRVFLSNGNYVDIQPEDMLHWRGYSATDQRIGVSRLETLRLTLAEEAAAQQASAELYKQGLAKPGYIKRPLEAPPWSETAREGFQRGWANQAKRSPRETPVLEEGMEFADFGVSPRDAQMLEGRKFTNEEVASLYGMKHAPPEGEDERKQFYADVLPPLTQAFACQLNFSLLQAEYAEDDTYYFELDMNEKLRGDPERRFAAITSAVGRPWMTVDEGRALENLPAVETGEELTIPLNVMVGDNPRPAPNVMPTQDPNGPPQDGSYREGNPIGTASAPAQLTQGKALVHPRHAERAARRDRYAAALEELLKAFYTRQENTVKAKGTKAPFATERWNRELAADLEPELRRIVEREGDISARRFGMYGFDTRQVENYLKTTATNVARDINAATRLELGQAKPADVFERARSTRAVVGAMTMATSMSFFAQNEAANQAPGTQKRQKTWVVISEDSEHPEMDGETVPLGATFSNGTEGPPADHPGCQCVIDIT